MKTTKQLFHLGLVITILMAIIASARADNTLTYTKINKDGSAGGAQKMMIRAGKMRIDLPEGKSAMIYDAAVDKIFILELEAKKYLTMDADMMKQLMGAMSALAAQFEAKLATIPEAKRAQMRAMMEKLGQGLLDGGKAPEIKSVVTGRKEMVGEYQTEVVEVMEGGVKTIAYYVVDRKSLKIGDMEYATMQKFQAFLGKWIKSLPGSIKQKMKIQMLMAEGNQLPVKVDHFENQSIKRTDQLTGVSGENLDPVLFEIPADFQQRELLSELGGLSGKPGVQ